MEDTTPANDTTLAALRAAHGQLQAHDRERVEVGTEMAEHALRALVNGASLDELCDALMISDVEGGPCKHEQLIQWTAHAAGTLVESRILAAHRAESS